MVMDIVIHAPKEVRPIPNDRGRFLLPKTHNFFFCTVNESNTFFTSLHFAEQVV